MIRKYHNHKLQANPWHREEEPHNNHETPGRQTKQSKHLDFFPIAMIAKVSNGAKIRNQYNQVPHLTQDTNGKVTNSQKTPQTRAKRSALSQQVTTKHI